MSFSVNVNPSSAATQPSFKSSEGTKGTLAVFAVFVLAFCIYDYSSYGHGFVAESLIHLQRWAQSTLGGFRVKNL